jgi:hypothetical protein
MMESIDPSEKKESGQKNSSGKKAYIKKGGDIVWDEDAENQR